MTYDKYKTYFYLKIHKKDKEIHKEIQSLHIGYSNREQFDAQLPKQFYQFQEENKLVLEMRGVWPPYKHACVTIMYIYSSAHHYLDEYFTMKSYSETYTNMIFSIRD